MAHARPGATPRTGHSRRAVAAVALLLFLQACGNGGVFGTGGSGPADTAGHGLFTEVPNGAEAGSSGGATLPRMQVAVAAEGDTLQSIAARAGTDAAELARLNGLPASYTLRPGDRIALPATATMPAGGDDGIQMASLPPADWSPELAGSAIDRAPASGTASPGPGIDLNDPVIDPIRHRVEDGETAYSIARLYGVSVGALSEWNGLGPDNAVRPGQELLIPIVSDANRIASAPASESQPGERTAVSPPPSAAAPLPPDTQTAALPESPQLGQYRTPPGGRLSHPVDAEVSRSFDPARNSLTSDGIGYAVAAGTAVRAAADGEVVLVSPALSDLGTVVMIRHGDDLHTVYGKLGEVRVQRGQRVRAGDPIAVVADGSAPELHFEVRRGTDAVNPAPYLGL